MRFILDRDLNMTGFRSCIISPLRATLFYTLLGIFLGCDQAFFHDKTHSHTKHEDIILVMNPPCANDGHY